MKLKLMIFLILGSLACGAQTHSKSIWTKEYEQDVYNHIDASIKGRMPDAQRRKALVTYVVMRLKSELPRGLKSVSQDSVYKLSVKIGAEYGYSHTNAENYDTGVKPAKRPWTPEIEHAFKETMFKGEKKDEHEFNQKLCDCTLSKLKAIYPDSVMLPLPREVIVKVVAECHDVIGNSNKH